MKKLLTILCAAMLITLAACGSNKDQESKPGDTMGLKDIFVSILKDVNNLPEVDYTEITPDNIRYYLFIDQIEGSEALACDSLINAVPHSAVLLRVPDGTDAAAVAKQIEDNADPRKWICVGAEKVIVKAHGNTILLVMSTTETADAIAANFDKLWE